MQEARGDLWVLVQPGDALVITTNGDVTKRGWAVMGRGVALEAAKAFEGVGLKERLGSLLQTNGNHAFLLAVPAPFRLVTMPVKRHWHEAADLDLIVRSAQELVRLADRYNWQTIWMPRPGCGNGRLNWADVKPAIEGILDDRFIAVTKE